MKYIIYSKKKKGLDNIKIEEAFDDVSFYPYAYDTYEEAESHLDEFKKDLKEKWDKFYDPEWMGDYVYYKPDLNSDRGYRAYDTGNLFLLIKALNEGGYATPEEAANGREDLIKQKKDYDREYHNIRSSSEYERNENFDKWFDGSVIKDKDGSPKIVYHGTGSQFEEFKTGLIFLTDDPYLANDYTVMFADRDMDDKTLYVRDKRNYNNVDSIDAIINKDYNRNTQEIYKDIEECPDLYCSGGTQYVDYDWKWYFFIMDKQTKRKKYFSRWDGPEEIQDWLKRLHKGGLHAFYLNFKNPYQIDNHGRDWEHIYYEGKQSFIDEFSDDIRNKGYDGIIIYNCSDGNGRCATEYIAYDSSQLKSVHNEGGFDSSKKNFYESKNRKKNVIRLTEEDLHNIIKESVVKYLVEEYGKWFQTEKNNIAQVANLMKEIKPLVANLDNLSPQEVWEVIRKLGYINHSAFKVKPGMWDMFPNEMLSDKDFRLNKSIYSFKERALELLVKYYLKHGYDVASDEKRSMIAFREPTTGVRQITFHVGKGSKLAQSLERNDATWDGVKQAHHYCDDESYDNEKNK